MLTSPPLLTEGLPIRRLGIVTQATATIWRDDTDPAQVHLPKGRLQPVTFPDQISMGNGWRLQHVSPTTGKLVSQNWLVSLFHDPLYKPSLCLNTYNIYNIGLLESIATVFEDVEADRYRANAEAPRLPGSSPYLHYYCPLEAPQEQYLLLYTNRFAPNERPNEVPSYADLYALVQVELDEEHFVFLLRQGIDMAEAVIEQKKRARSQL